ncbi:AAA family ATPase [Agrobacterium pusense]|uniref:AAA family ATPase n=1 Tax=Agrobacterium pusense TaxID=648995 RepID=UPI001181ECCA|nr:AAA family ATPase [Agrobacterium pusense]
MSLSAYADCPVEMGGSSCNVSIDYVMDVAHSVKAMSVPSRYHMHPGVKELYARHPTMIHRSIYETLVEGVDNLYSNNQILEYAHQCIKVALDGHEVVYLPTYRRIEMSLSRYQPEAKNDPFEDPARRSINILPSEIKFGLSDITERLQEISLEIQRKSNTTYQKISANIINELLDGSYADASSNNDSPDKSELELFFNRIRATRARNASQIVFPDIEKIYSGDFDEGVKPFLLYFLSNLNEAIKSTKPLEDRVNGFLVACNSYLSDTDASAFKDGGKPGNSTDKKGIRINRSTFRPYFTSGNKDSRIRIDALSSGEKQVVSLFARLFLYEKKKIILFDEPELSLSIGWQAKLLPDLCRAPDFAQLIAITHSPFIFDNELDKYAGNLDVAPYEAPGAQLSIPNPLDTDDAEDSFEDESSSKGSLF